MEEESTSSPSTRNGEEKKEQKRGVEQIILMNESIVYSFTVYHRVTLVLTRSILARVTHWTGNYSGLGTTNVCCRRGVPPATEQLAW